MLRAGQSAPAFTAKSTEGHDVSLATFRGKILVLYFFPKAFTGG